MLSSASSKHKAVIKSQGFKKPHMSKQNMPKQSSFYFAPAFWDIFDKTAVAIEESKGSVWIQSPPSHGCSSLIDRLAGRLRSTDRMTFIVRGDDLQQVPHFISHLGFYVGQYLNTKGLTPEIVNDPTEQLGLYLQVLMQEGLTLCVLVDDPDDLSHDVCDLLKTLTEFRSEINNQVICNTPIVKFVFIGNYTSADPWQDFLKSQEDDLVRLTLPPLSLHEAITYMRMRLKSYAINPYTDAFTEEAAEEVFLLSQGLMKRLVVLMNYSTLFMKAGTGQVLSISLLDHIVHEAVKTNPDLMNIIPEDILFQNQNPVQSSLMKKLVGLFRK